MRAVMERKRRPSWNSDGVESIGGHQLSTTVAQTPVEHPARWRPVSINPDASHRRPDVRPVSHLHAARWAQFERIATELLDDFDAEHKSRAADLYDSWGERAAELNDPNEAKECHSIATALRQRVELIRRYPGEFTEVMAVLTDIFSEKNEEVPG